jgi:hypothetical protein
MTSALARFRSFMPFWKEPHANREEIAQFFFHSPVYVAFTGFLQDYLFFNWHAPVPPFQKVLLALAVAQTEGVLDNIAEIDKSTWGPERHYALFILRVRLAALEEDFYPGAKEPDKAVWSRQLYETLIYNRHLWLLESKLVVEPGMTTLS